MWGRADFKLPYLLPCIRNKNTAMYTHKPKYLKLNQQQSNISPILSLKPLQFIKEQKLWFLSYPMVTICASSNHSPTLPTISLYSVPIKSSFRTQQPLSSPSSSSSDKNIGLSLVSDDLLTMAAAAEAVALANAAAEAARDAVLFHGCFEHELENNGMLKSYSSSSNESRVVKRRRRKQRKALSKSSDVELTSHYWMENQCSIRTVQSGYLTARQEAEFSLCLKEGARLEAARRKIVDTRKHEPTPSQWAEAVGMKKERLDRVLCNTKESKERITLSYRRLVVSIASAYQGKGLSLQDLIQEGSIGLLRGAEKFDPMKGYKLSTYIYWWIKQAIIRALANKSRLVRLPGGKSEMLAKIAEANTVLSIRLRRLPTYDEIADMLGMNVSSVRLISQRNRLPTSADQPLTNRGRMTIQEIIPGPEETRPETMVNKKLMKQEVEKLIKTLSEREAYTLRLYFGFNGETPRSCDEIGRLLNLSRERVRQINCIALTKLRQSSLVDSLKVYIV